MATRIPARDPLAGTGLPDRYSLIQRIAAGGMATVWCAEDGVLGRRVAIKLLADHFADDFVAVRRFKREARTAARVSEHPNIITIFDVGETVASDRRERARPFIVMEHLPGGTLADALRTGEVSRDDALKWLREASSALDYAHEHGVIHRDIKPANMLLDRARSLHVGDFGIARIAHEDTITKGGQLFGTAAYLSPEQARGEPGTEASDRYALAVVAFELLTGERVFAGEHFAAQARAHIEDAPPAASEVNALLPPAVDSVLTRGLAKAQDDRWPSAGAFADALTTAIRSRRPPRTGPETGPIFIHRSEPISRRPRAIALGALGAAVALAIVAAVVLATAGGGSAGHRTASTRAATHHRTATSDDPPRDPPAAGDSSPESAGDDVDPAATARARAPPRRRAPRPDADERRAERGDARGARSLAAQRRQRERRDPGPAPGGVRGVARQPHVRVRAVRPRPRAPARRRPGGGGPDPRSSGCGSRTRPPSSARSSTPRSPRSIRQPAPRRSRPATITATTRPAARRPGTGRGTKRAAPGRAVRNATNPDRRVDLGTKLTLSARNASRSRHRSGRAAFLT